MGRGGRKVERDGRWVMCSMNTGLTGRDGMEQGMVRTLIFFCQGIVTTRFQSNSITAVEIFVGLTTAGNWKSLSAGSVLHHNLPLSFLNPWNSLFIGRFSTLLAFLLGQRNLSGKKVLQDSSSQSHVVRCLQVREPGRRNPAPARYLSSPFPRASWLRRIDGKRWRG